MKRGTRVKVISPKSQYYGKLGTVVRRSGIGKRVMAKLDGREYDGQQIEFFPSELKPTRKDGRA